MEASQLFNMDFYSLFEETVARDNDQADESAFFNY